MASANLTQLLGTLITALHILHFNDVLDAYGHLSVRNPDDSSTFFMSRNMAPALVASRGDIVEYFVSNASAVDAAAPKGFLERYIHSEVYRRYPAVNSVVHSHSSAVIPYSVGDAPLKPVIHLAGFLGDETPVFDISKHYHSNDSQDILVRTATLGEALAAEFSRTSPAASVPDHAVVLMRNHGFTACAADIETAVFQAVYAQVNAAAQSAALANEEAFVASGGGKSGRGIAYLTHQQAVDSWAINIGTIQRPWELWVRQVTVDPLYVNELDA